MAKNYQILSTIYDTYWGSFAQRYSELVLNFIPEKGQITVLDLACGTGSLAINLARNGFNVKGIDISTEMIEVANLKKNSIKGVEFKVDNMLNPDINRKVDIITCAFDSVNYLLNSSDVRKMFNSSFELLHPGGRFIFDFNTEKAYRKNNNFEIRRMVPGGYYDHKMTYNSHKRLAQTIFEFFDGQWELHIQKPYEYKEITQILQQVGFEILFTFNNFKGEPVKQDSDRVFVVAEKPK
ncbi:methyltransferase domain-containing protein [Proteinivorax tanatarense]|uniref:Methyltransferase domain-containing protein n=1 Tax=Proteinivorax tanatarense TaxID=1260629 RepID=A0AAU7VPA5_9FIRM